MAIRGGCEANDDADSSPRFALLGHAPDTRGISIICLVQQPHEGELHTKSDDITGHISLEANIPPHHGEEHIFSTEKSKAIGFSAREWEPQWTRALCRLDSEDRFKDLTFEPGALPEHETNRQEMEREVQAGADDVDHKWHIGPLPFAPPRMSTVQRVFQAIFDLEAFFKDAVFENARIEE